MTVVIGLQATKHGQFCLHVLYVVLTGVMVPLSQPDPVRVSTSRHGLTVHALPKD